MSKVLVEHLDASCALLGTFLAPSQAEPLPLNAVYAIGTLLRSGATVLPAVRRPALHILNCNTATPSSDSTVRAAGL